MGYSSICAQNLLLVGWGTIWKHGCRELNPCLSQVGHTQGKHPTACYLSGPSHSRFLHRGTKHLPGNRRVNGGQLSGLHLEIPLGNLQTVRTKNQVCRLRGDREGWLIFPTLKRQGAIGGEKGSTQPFPTGPFRSPAYSRGHNWKSHKWESQHETRGPMGRQRVTGSEIRLERDPGRKTEILSSNLSHNSVKCCLEPSCLFH